MSPAPSTAIVCGRVSSVAAFAHRAPGQMRDRPEQEHDRRPARQRRHRVDEHGRLSGASEHREEARDHHEERRSGRVSYLELVRRRDKLAAIPEAGRGLHRQKVNRRREDEAEPADDQVEFLETVLHAVVLRYVKFRRAFRPIRPERRRIIPAKLENNGIIRHFSLNIPGKFVILRLVSKFAEP